MTEWEQEWNEGLETLNGISVALESHKNNLHVIEQRLDRLDALNETPTLRKWLSGLFTKENENE